MSAAVAPPHAGAAEPVRRERKPLRHVVGRVASTIGLVLVVSIAALMLVPSILGYHRYVIISGSMEPAIPTGSIVYDKAVPVDDLKVGDVITFLPPPEYGLAYPVTHRIHEIGKAPANQQDAAAAGRTFRTKGDANPAPDPWTIILHSDHQDRVEHHIPKLGYVYEWLSQRWVQILVFGIPALIIGIIIIRALWKEAGYAVVEEREAKRRKPPKGDAV